MLMGREGSGKTCLSSRFVDGTFSQLHQRTSSLHITIGKLENVRGKAVKLIIYEPEGAQSYANCDFTVLKCKAFVFCYDITDKRSLEDIPAMIDLNTRTSKSKDMEFCLLGTKIDLEEQRAVLTNDAIKFAEKNKMTYLMEVSALQDINVEKAFDRLAEVLLAKMGEITIELPIKSARTGAKNSHKPPQNKLEKEEDLQANSEKPKCTVS